MNFPAPIATSRRTSLPLRQMVRHKIAGKPDGELSSQASRQWELAPGECKTTRPAIFLPNQLDRITGWVFTDRHPGSEMQGGEQVWREPTRAFLVENAWLIDGVVYKGEACLHLRPREHRWTPQLRTCIDVDQGALFCSYPGNKYFGNWLLDDCLAYPLTEGLGLPVTTHQPPSAHMLAYEKLLGMRPMRLHSAFFKRLVFFDDKGENADRHRRATEVQTQLLGTDKVAAHPGVFILRGTTGDKRVLRNELALAEQLRASRGFRILDISNTTVEHIISVCAGAQVVVGIEGSQLMHGIQLLPRGGSLLILQPPNRFCHVYKPRTDRDGQYFGFVVGIEDGDGFHIDPDELERTLDLFPKTAPID